MTVIACFVVAGCCFAGGYLFGYLHGWNSSIKKWVKWWNHVNRY